MKAVLILGIVGVSVGVAAAHPGAVRNLYEGLYQDDPAKRAALDRCFAMDHQFNRLDATERADCYRHVLTPLPSGSGAAPISAAPPPTPTANFVDLWRAGGQGHLPQNDVRSQQQNDRYLRAPAGRTP